jgi:type I restriction enzyme R subunit
MTAIGELLDRSIAAEGYVIPEVEHRVDLSQIDFDALRKQFEKSRKRTEAERLRVLVERKLHDLMRLNRTRMDYAARLQELIDEYNSGAVNVEEFFKRLMVFAQALKQEEKRAIAEKLNEEELAIFDLLTKPEMELNDSERKQIKAVARELLLKVKTEKLVLDWRKRQQSRAEVQVTIDDILDRGLPEKFTREVYKQKCDLIYQHFYDNYFGEGRSVYAEAGAPQN